MSDDRISSNDAIDKALQLDGDPRRLRQYYADWARCYDLDVRSAEYTGPAISARLLRQHAPDTAARVLDAGCGTGLVGVELHAFGYRHVDGFDLSAEMAGLALATGVYRRVSGNVDIMRVAADYDEAGYDALLCVGVFTLGHVPPQALPELIPLVRNGGILVISTRSHYYDQTGYQQCVDDLRSAGRLEELQVVWNAPYNHDGDAHYWVFRKLSEQD